MAMAGRSCRPRPGALSEPHGLAVERFVLRRDLAPFVFREGPQAPGRRRIRIDRRPEGAVHEEIDVYEREADAALRPEQLAHVLSNIGPGRADAARDDGQRTFLREAGAELRDDLPPLRRVDGVEQIVD